MEEQILGFAELTHETQFTGEPIIPGAVRGKQPRLPERITTGETVEQIAPVAGLDDVGEAFASIGRAKIPSGINDRQRIVVLIDEARLRVHQNNCPLSGENVQTSLQKTRLGEII